MVQGAPPLPTKIDLKRFPIVRSDKGKKQKKSFTKIILGGEHYFFDESQCLFTQIILVSVVLS